MFCSVIEGGCFIQGAIQSHNFLFCCSMLDSPTFALWSKSWLTLNSWQERQRLLDRRVLPSNRGSIMALRTVVWTFDGILVDEFWIKNVERLREFNLLFFLLLDRVVIFGFDWNERLVRDILRDCLASFDMLPFFSLIVWRDPVIDWFFSLTIGLPCIWLFKHSFNWLVLKIRVLRCHLDYFILVWIRLNQLFVCLSVVFIQVVRER